MQYYTFIYAAQTQISTLLPYLSFLIAAVAAIISVKSLNLKKMEHKEVTTDKIATKIFVRDQFSKIETTTLQNEARLKDFKEAHQKQHDQERVSLADYKITHSKVHDRDLGDLREVKKMVLFLYQKEKSKTG